MFDVGQGDSILLHLNNYNILVDTGGNTSYDLSNNITIPVLKSLGISQIDYLILTHGDYDHMGEAINLVNNFKVEKVIFNCGEFNDLEQDLIKILDKNSDDYSISLRRLFDGVKGIPASTTKSAAKRVNMMLRWLVRDDGIVDFGIWKTLDKRKLLIPLDTHVHQQGRAMGITTRNSADITTAKEITDYMKTIFPDDPTLGDFALFGLGVDEDGK